MKGSERARDYFIDNLKAVLIVLVIIGHFSMKYDWVPAVERLGKLIYTFHMPCFVFVSGYLAKGVHREGKLKAERIFSFVWLYLLFEILLSLTRWGFGRGFHLSLFRVNQAPWYLLSMTMWYLLVPLIERVRPVWMLIGSAAAGIAAGYLDFIGWEFSMSKSIVYLPFFAAGFYLSWNGLKGFLDRKILKALSVILLLGAVLLYLLAIAKIRPFLGIIYGGVPYSEVASLPSAGWGGAFRLLWYGVSVLLFGAVMQLTPKKKTWFSFLGARTLQIYILHVVVRNVLVFCGFVDWCRILPGEINFLLVWGGSILLAILLGNPLFEKVFHFLEGGRLFGKLLK